MGRSHYAKEIVVKDPGETITVDFVLTDDPALSTGENLASIATPTVTPAGVTVSGEQVNVRLAQMNLAAGTDGGDHDITATLTTDLGQILVRCGRVQVRACS